MVNEIPVSEADVYRSPQPTIRTIGWPDIKDALAEGLADFKEMPTHVAFLCVIYPFVMLIMARALAGYDVLPLVFPFLAGYTLIGPLVATGMYELSRRREHGLDSRRRHALDVFRSPALGSIAALGILLMAIYFAWLAAAQAIYGQYLGAAAPESIPAFITQVISTPAGWSVIVVGNGIGFLFAALVLTLSVVSFPMLLDRDVGVAMAVQTSIRAVLANPVTMALWGLVVSVTMFIGALPFFVGLVVVLPVLGHATWHLYRKVVEHPA